MVRARWAVLGWVAGFLLACGQTEQAGDADDTADRDVAGRGGGAGSPTTGGVAQAGQPSLSVDPNPVPPAPRDLCSCPGADLGLTVVRGTTSVRLSFNIAEQGSCGPDQPAHVGVRSGCGTSLSLALSADAAGGIPRLTIQGSELTYTDAENVVWSGLMPSRLDARAGEDSVLKSSVELQVVNAAGDQDVLQLTFELCSDSSSLRVPC